MTERLTDRLTAAFLGHLDHVDRALFGEARDEIARLLEYDALSVETIGKMNREQIALHDKLREAVEIMAPFRGVGAMLGSACQDDERRWPGAKPMPTVGELKRIDAFLTDMEKTNG
jgi:hypothetical protein